MFFGYVISNYCVGIFPFEMLHSRKEGKARFSVSDEQMCDDAI